MHAKITLHIVLEDKEPAADLAHDSQFLLSQKYAMVIYVSDNMDNIN